ncbi:epoxyqueuosine reductase QueH [Xiamenia xianingshaonis]|uniref:Epoxyqueuosine reductase QueH n=2 Tax=Xiamenia xianingshaonis TaxID=2682776 RepID=A0A9E6SVG6_9ACTN|nr:epoxyqueuosine reductase QueH [Xiamenia xianingshaonis]
MRVARKEVAGATGAAGPAEAGREAAGAAGPAEGTAAATKAEAAAETEREAAALATLDPRLRAALAVDPDARAARCRACYRLRFEEAARYAVEHGFDAIGTTLSVSPYQYTDVIEEELDRAAARHGLDSVFRDFRPYYDEATRRSREAGMYRQNFCGCRLSDTEAQAERQLRKAMRAAERAAHAAERQAQEAKRAEKRAERQAYQDKQQRKHAILKAMRKQMKDQVKEENREDERL